MHKAQEQANKQTKNEITNSCQTTGKRNNKNVWHLPLVALVAATWRIRNMQLTRPFPFGYVPLSSLAQVQIENMLPIDVN